MVNKITNNNFTLIQVAVKTSNLKKKLEINPKIQVKIIAGVII